MKIRDATLDDLPAIVAIYNASIAGRRATGDTTPVTVESRRAWFDAHDPDRRPLWVAVLEEADVAQHEQNGGDTEAGADNTDAPGTIAGWISLRNFYDRMAYHATAEIAMYIATAYQGHGLGRMLKQQMLAACPRLGVRNVISLVFGHNDASIALNRKLGFTHWGTMPGIAEMDGHHYDLQIWGLKIPTPGSTTTPTPGHGGAAALAGISPAPGSNSRPAEAT